MPKFLSLFTCIAGLALGGCNQHVAVIETPVSPTQTPPSAPQQQPGIASVVVAPGAVFGGDGATGIVRLTAPAQAPGLFVSMSSSDDVASVPSVVGIPAGNTFVRFGVTTLRFPDDRTVVISASTPEGTVTTSFGVWTIEAPVFFHYLSDEDDFIGDGGFARFVPGTSTISAVCDRNEVRVRITAPGSQVWSATFRGHGSEPLRAGVAYDVFSAGEKEYGPDLDISSQGRVCSTTDGRFLVEEIDLRNNRVNLFRATFEQRCNDSDGALYGEVRIENMPPSSPAVNCFR